MVEAYEHLGAGSTVQVSHYASERLYEIKEKIRRLEAERGMWEGILARFEPCQNCGGLGELRVFDEGETQARRQTCEECNGDGRARKGER